MANLRPGDVLQERYRIDRLLGEGGMSWVYRGHHLLLEQPVAIKVIKPLFMDPTEAREHAEQLRVEAGIMARLDHPNLVRAFDMFRQGGSPVLILEMVDGRNLDEVAQLAPKPISERRVLAWTAQILDALEYLHSQQPPVIVRDLKPGNVMLGKDGRVRLIDFGLAKQMDSQGSGTRAFIRGMGSEGFAPLEQYAQSSTDARSDLYALGATIYFMLTKVAPPPPSLRIADSAALHDPRKVNPSVTARTWSAIQDLLALKANDRPPSAAAARLALGLPDPRRAPEKDADGAEAPARAASRPPGKRCASCDVLLYPSVKDGVEIDCCGECGGVWLDRGELGRLVELGRGAEAQRAASAHALAHGAAAPSTSNQAQPGPRSANSSPQAGGAGTAPGQTASGRPQDNLSRGLYRVWKLLDDLFE